MSWTWVIRMLVILIVLLLVIAGTVVALRLTDPGSEEAEECHANCAGDASDASCLACGTIADAGAYARS